MLGLSLGGMVPSVGEPIGARWVCECRGCFPFNDVISGTAAFSVIAVETVVLEGSSRKYCKFF